MLALLLLTTLTAPPLANAGFELGLADWTVGRWAAYAAADTARPHTGAQCARLRCDSADPAPWLHQAATGLAPLATYRFRAWCRGEAGAKAAAAVKIECYNAAGQNTSGYYGRVVPGDTWQTVEVTARADPDTTRAALLLRLYGPGTVWFDDASFEQTLPAPRLATDLARAAAAPGEVVTLRLWSAVPLTEQSVRLTVDLPQPVSAAVLPGAADGPWTTATVRLPALPPGDYTAHLTAADTDLPLKLFVPPAVRQPANLSDSGTLRVGGQPFFPIGLYHVALTDYAAVAAQGFNCVQGSGTNDLAELEASLRAAQQAGLKVDVPLYAGGQVARNLPASRLKLQRFGQHPAVLCWKILDEPDIRPEVSDEVPAAYRELKALDPRHPIELTLCQPEQYRYWSHFADLFQVDPYPLPREPLTQVSDYVQRARSHLAPWQNLTAVLQAGWLQRDGVPTNQPTAAQARVMVGLALVAGAKGIFWYSLHDPDWDLRRTPLWPALPAIHADTARWGQRVLGSVPVPGSSCSNPALRVAVWRQAGGAWWLAVNPTDAPQQGQLTWPGGTPVPLDLPALTVAEGA